MMRLLARGGRPGRELGVRLDLVRGLGPRAAWRRRGEGAQLARLEEARARLYGRIWLDAAAKVGAEVRDLGGGFLELRRGTRRTRVRDETTELDDLVTIDLSEDKALVHRLLTGEGLPVPEHVEVSAGAPGPAHELLRGGAVVVKPASGTGVGTGVTGGVEDAEQLGRAVLRAARSGGRILVERSADGDVYRFLLLDGELLDVVRRRPPTVVGDGRSSVDELIAAENSRRLEADGEEGLWLLRADLDLVLALERQGLRPSAVPDAGRRVAVKSVTNQNRAEDNETVREEISEELVAEARHAAELVGLRLAGVDLVTTDLTRPLVESGGVILEVNCTPGLHHHLLVADRAGATDVATPILRKLLGDD